MKLRLSLLATIALLISCAAPISEFYPDRYYREDSIYDNKLIDFTLSFRGGWQLTTNPNALDHAQKQLAKILNRQGVEMLFVGYTPDKMQGVRALASNLNLPTRQYAEQIWQLNHSSAQSDSGMTEMLVNNIPMIRWQYMLFGLRYAEFFFTLDTYNVRIAFWTTPDRFERFLPVYIDIMASLSYGGMM